MRKRIFSGIFIMSVFLVVLAFGIIGAAGRRPTESVTEKRDLAAFPTLTLAGILDGSFLSELGDWYADTFPLREEMIATNADIEDHYGPGGDKLISTGAETEADEIPTTEDVTAADTMEIPSLEEDGTAAAEENASETEIDENARDGSIKDEPEKVGDIYIAGGSGFSLYQFNQESVDSYASMVNTVAERLGSDKNVYAIPTPNAFGVMLPKATQEKLAQYEGDAFDYLYKRFSDRVKVVQTFNDLVNHNSEYIYFRTDHHWTARGAYYAYRQFCKVKGFTPHELGDYEVQVSEDFLGSYYSFSKKSPELTKNPDTIYAYKPISTNEMTMINHDGKKMKYMIIQPGNTYSVFIAGDEPWEKIDNPDINDGSACVLIKDSYGDAFAPFLVDHYDKTYIVDFRYYKDDLTQMIEDRKVTDVIFLNNAEFLTKSNSKKILSLFKFDKH